MSSSTSARDLAACRGMRTKVFFHSERERGPARRTWEAAAKAICHRCPVIMACREHALCGPESYGIWGGLSADDESGANWGRQGVPGGWLGRWVSF